jgi:hypothetical protein
MAAFDVISEGMELYPPGAVAGRGLDWLYSPSRLYFAAFEANGDFNVYRGDNPDDPGRTLVWSNAASRSIPAGYVPVSMKLRAGPFDRNTKNLQTFCHHPTRGSTLTLAWQSGGSRNLAAPLVAALRDDGGLVLRQGEAEIWWNGFSDPVKAFIPQRVTYDAPRGTIHTDEEVDVLESIVNNDGDITQPGMKLSDSRTVTFTSTWSKTHTASFSIGAELQVALPGVGHAKVTSTTSTSDAFTWGETKTKTKTIGFELQVNVPAHATYRGWASLRQADFEVPYTVLGELHFQSGAKVTHQFSGMYKGRTGYTGVAHIVPVKPDGSPLKGLMLAEGPSAGVELLPEAPALA